MTGSDEATKIEKKKIFSVFAPEGIDRNNPRSLSGDITVFQEDLSNGKNMKAFFFIFKIVATIIIKVLDLFLFVCVHFDGTLISIKFCQ